MPAVTLLLGSEAFVVTVFDSRFVFAPVAVVAFEAVVFARVVVFFRAVGFLACVCPAVSFSALTDVLAGEVRFGFAFAVVVLAFAEADRLVRDGVVARLREVEVVSDFTSSEATGESAIADLVAFGELTLAPVEVEAVLETLALVFAVAAAFERVEVVVFFAAVFAFAAVVGFAFAVGLLVVLGFRVVVLAVGRFVELVALVEVAASVCTAALL